MSAVVDLSVEREARGDVAPGFEDVPPIMSPGQLADVLDVSVRTLERWRDLKEGPDFQHPEGTRFYRYYRRDLLAWLENKKPEVAASGQTNN